MRLEMYNGDFPGKLITFCGLDGCGKTTLLDRLKNYLKGRGFPVYVTKQPTDFVRNSDIFRNYIDSPDHTAYDYRALSLLCASDRVQHSNRVIVEKLREGTIVLSDRYFYSCLANLNARGYTQDFWIYEIARFIPRPDLAFFLDVDVDTAIRRVRARPSERDRFIDEPLQHRLRAQYLAIAKENRGICVSTANTPAPAEQRIQNCFLQIRNEVDRLV